VHFHIVTLFPEFFDSPLSCALLAKGRDAGRVGFTLHNPRDFTEDRHRTVDDRPYGGGPGMVMMCGPVAGALRSIDAPGRMLVMSPRGRPLDQNLTRELAAEPALTLVCGRYEGLDERLMELFPLQPVSVGDFVLGGGESAALALVEAVSRLLPEFMGHEESADEESFSDGLLEYPHYTRPEEFEGLTVPDALTSGDHARIAAWRRERAVLETLSRRPDLLATARLAEADVTILRAVSRRRLGRGLHLGLVHYPVLNKKGQVTAVSLTNLDVHDIARVSRTYGCGGYHIATPLEDQRNLLEKLLNHWTDGAGKKANADRSDALSGVTVHSCLEEIRDEVRRRAGSEPLVVATTARGAGDTTVAALRAELERRPVLLVMGTASGLAPEVMEQVDTVLRPVRLLDDYNHLSVRSATAILVDRLLGDGY